MGRRRRSGVRREEFPSGELALAAMVDMMINLLIFLLTLYGTDPIDVKPEPNLLVPTSTATRPVQYAADLRVTTREVRVNGVSVLQLEDGPKGPRIPAAALQDGLVPALTEELSRLAATLPPPEDPADANRRKVDLQADKSISWEVLGPVIETAGRAGFVKLRFVVRTVEEGGAP